MLRNCSQNAYKSPKFIHSVFPLSFREIHPFIHKILFYLYSVVSACVCIAFYFAIWRASTPFSICLSTACTAHSKLCEGIFNKNTLIRLYLCTRLFHTLFSRLSATTAATATVKLFRVIWRLFCSEIHECKREHSNVNVCTNRKHRSPLVTLV